MGKVITFGEIMLRLQTEGYLRFTQTTGYNATYGGGDANVAASLANFGFDTAFVTKLPANELGDAAVHRLRSLGIQTDYIIRGGNRIGIYFLEKGASQRPSKVIYDRAHSAIAEASREDFNWAHIFHDASWFHFTGITPALSPTLAEICYDACTAAKRHGLTVSCDLNYRKSLWSPAAAEKVMSGLMPFVDVCIANEEDAEKVFGCKLVAITLRTSISASDNNWSALLWDGQHLYTTRTYAVHIVDRVGGGDSFCAGLIYGLMQDFGLQKTLDFAVAASCLKHTIEGDFNMVTVSEVMNLASGDSSGRVIR